MQKMERMFIWKKDQIPENWKDHLLVIWEEDDSLAPDRETIKQALKRLAPDIEYKEPFHMIDYGDAVFYFYQPGWVKALCCDVNFIAILIRPDERYINLNISGEIL